MFINTPFVIRPVGGGCRLLVFARTARGGCTSLVSDRGIHRRGHAPDIAPVLETAFGKVMCENAQ